MKLQQAYFSESAKVGGWTLIGYTAPNEGNTTNFLYGIGTIGTQASADLADGTVAWQAANKNQLNDCAAVTGATAKSNITGANWSITLKTIDGQVSDVGFTAAANGAGCVALTPSFEKIGK